MGFRQAVVLSSVSFFLGVLFICFNIDQKILFQPLTDKSVEEGFQFYATFYNAPLAVKGLMHAMIGLGILALLSKLHKWDESAMFFDGSSLILYMFGVVLYGSVTVGGLRTIVNADEGKEGSSELSKTDALRALSAGNTLIILCLIGVLCLQGGQEYASRLQAKLSAKEKAKVSVAAPAAEEKKNQ